MPPRRAARAASRAASPAPSSPPPAPPPPGADLEATARAAAVAQALIGAGWLDDARAAALYRSIVGQAPSTAPLPPADAAALDALVSTANAALDALHLSIKHVVLPAVDGDDDDDDDDGGGAPSTRPGAWALVNADPDAAARAHGAPWAPGVGAYLKAVLAAAAGGGGAAGVIDAGAALAVVVDDAPPPRATPRPAAAGSDDDDGAGDGPSPAPRAKPLPRAARRDALAAFVAGGWLRRVRGGGALAIGPRAFLELGDVLAGAPGVGGGALAEWRAMGVVTDGGGGGGWGEGGSEMSA